MCTDGLRYSVQCPPPSILSESAMPGARRTAVHARNDCVCAPKAWLLVGGLLHPYARLAVVWFGRTRPLTATGALGCGVPLPAVEVSKPATTSQLREVLSGGGCPSTVMQQSVIGGCRRTACKGSYSTAVLCIEAVVLPALAALALGPQVGAPHAARAVPGSMPPLPACVGLSLSAANHTKRHQPLPQSAVHYPAVLQQAVQYISSLLTAVQTGHISTTARYNSK